MRFPMTFLMQCEEFIYTKINKLSYKMLNVKILNKYLCRQYLKL